MARKRARLLNADGSFKGTVAPKGGATPKKRGTSFEYSVIANLKRNDWPLAVRAYASKGPWDVLAIRETVVSFDAVAHVHCPEVWLIQAKIGGYMRPAERAALVEAAEAIGATPIMATTKSRRIVYSVVESPTVGDAVKSTDGYGSRTAKD